MVNLKQLIPVFFLLFHICVNSLSVTDRCNKGLRYDYVNNSNFMTPRNSPAWKKSFNLLKAANESKAIIVIPYFYGIRERVKELLLGSGVSNILIFDEAEGPFLSVYNPGKDVVFEMSYYAAISKNPRSSIYIVEGKEHVHNRVLIQSEQLDGRFGLQVINYLSLCNSSDRCAIWDYSDLHARMLTEHGLGSSVMTLPVMLQSLPQEFTVTPALGLRTKDIVFYATMLDRRKVFLERLQAAGSFEMDFFMTRNMAGIYKGYRNAKICLCLHISHPYSAGEWHRLAEVIHTGCIPVFESFGDLVGVETVAACGGVHFADYDHLIPTIKSLLNSVANETSVNWLARTTKASHWWQQQFSDINYILKDIFG